MRRFLLRALGLFHRGRAERELARELEAHLHLIEDDLRRRGMTAQEAHRAARIALGGVERTKALHREARSFTWVDDLRRDTAHAARQLLHNPAFALTATASLAIAIGANTAIFTTTNALLFREPVAVVGPEQLVDIGVVRGGGGMGPGAFYPGSYLNFLDVRQAATGLEDAYAITLFAEAVSFRAEGSRAAERIFANFVTPNYFTVLGVRPAAGRLLDQRAFERDAAGEDSTVVLSHRFWTRRFAADPAIVGRSLMVNGREVVVAGVAAEGFQGTGVRGGDVWLTVTSAANGLAAGGPALLRNRRAAWLLMGGRLKAGVTVEQAAAQVDAIGRTLEREHPADNRGKGLVLARSAPIPGSTTVISLFLALLSAMAATVLLIACANIVGVLLARATARRREIAVRLALGAGRGRVVRQLLTETLLLFLAGGAAALLAAGTVTSFLVARLPELPVPIDVPIAVDWRVAAFTAGVCFLAALMSGLAPALHGTRADVVSALKDDGGGLGGRLGLRRVFLVAQIACSILLVVVTGLFLRALYRGGADGPGFEPRGVELRTMDLPAAGYDDVTGRLFVRDLLDRVRALPFVEEATVAAVLPGGFEGLGLGSLSVPEAPASTTEPLLELTWNVVEPRYFATLRLPLVSGRDFTDADRAGAEPVIILGEGAAAHFWPGRNALGRQLRFEEAGVQEILTVVGIARDPTVGSLIDSTDGVYVYRPLQQAQTPWTMLVTRARTSGSTAEALRGLIAATNPNLAMGPPQSAEAYAALGLLPQRIAASISGSLGLVGLLLAAVGIYGVTAYSVARRTREIGIRVALGADRRHIIRMIGRQGLVISAIGSVLGLAMGALVSVPLTDFLYGVRPIDPPTFIGTAALFAVVSLAASYVPARRAASAAPAAAVRRE